MTGLEKWESIIKEKRKNIDFRSVIKEIGSYVPLMFYKNQGFISKYPPKTGRIGTLVSPKEFGENRDALMRNGQENNKDNFFGQFGTLFREVKLSSLFSVFDNENCDYVEDAFGAKDSYLSFGIGSNSEKAFYTFIAKDNCKNVYNSSEVVDCSENIYMSTGITKSYNIFYSKFVTGCANIWFSTNLIGCNECIFCNNLQNKNFCINNKELSKEEYTKQKTLYLKQKGNFTSIYARIQKHGENFASKNIDGSFIVKSENIQNGKYVYQTKNGRNLFMVGGEKGNENMFDIILGGTVYAKDAYGCSMFGTYSENLYLSQHITISSNIYYSISLESCSFCLGCIGLKNKSYCILNKQYTKEEWYENANKIFSQMEKDGILGDFFPGNLNPFYFNDTLAYLLDDSFTKEEVEKDGYLWRDEEVKVDIPEGAETVETKNLSHFQGFDENGNWYINPDILKKVIKDKNGNVYKIVKMEYDFLVKHSLPLPEIHWLERIKLGFKFK